VGIVLLLLGAALALATFTRNIWAAWFGLGLMASGATLLIGPQVRRKRQRALVRPLDERGQWAPRRRRDWLT
jgi:hypothetical protein